MCGLRPAVIGLIASALLSIAQQVFLQSAEKSLPAVLTSAAVFGLMTLLSFRKVHPVLIIVLSGVIGVAAGYMLGL